MAPFCYRSILKFLPVRYQPRRLLLAAECFRKAVIRDKQKHGCALVCLPYSAVLVAGLVIRPNSLDITFNKSDPLKYQDYVQHLETFLQSKSTSTQQRDEFTLKPILFRLCQLIPASVAQDITIQSRRITGNALKENIFCRMTLIA